MDIASTVFKNYGCRWKSKDTTQAGAAIQEEIANTDECRITIEYASKPRWGPIEAAKIQKSGMSGSVVYGDNWTVFINANANTSLLAPAVIDAYPSANRVDF